jgi:cytochrome P450
MWPLSVGLWTDPDFVLRNARRHGPVFKTRQLVRPMVCIVDLPVGRRLLGEHDADLDAPPLPFNRFIPGGFLRWRDHDSHGKYKSLFRDAFSRDVVAANETQIRAGMQHALSEIATEDAVEPRARINRMLFPLWARLFLGVDDAARLKELSHVLDVRRSHRLRERSARRAVEEAMDTVRSAPRTAPSFLSSLPEDALEDPAVAGSLFYLMLLTWADVSGLLAWIVRMSSEHPRMLDRIRREPEFAGPFVRETLRLSQSEYLYRRARRDIPVGDVVVPSGWLVRICVREAHRTAFERGADFDPGRFVGQRYGRDEYSPFGAHRLACLGEHVTLEVARWFTLELANYRLDVVRDGQVEYSSWSHWRPSRNLRVKLAPAEV